MEKKFDRINNKIGEYFVQGIAKTNRPEVKDHLSIIIFRNQDNKFLLISLRILAEDKNSLAIIVMSWPTISQYS